MKCLFSTTLSTLSQFFILADSTSDAAALDELAADHVDGDALVHYGAAALDAAPARLPARIVLPRDTHPAAPVAALAAALADHAVGLPPGTPGIVLLPAQGLAGLAAAVAAAMAGKVCTPVVAARPAATILLPGARIPPPPADASVPVATTVTLAGLAWESPAGAPPAACAFVWFSRTPAADADAEPAPPLDLLRLSLAAAPAWSVLDPGSGRVEALSHAAPRRALGRRYYAIQRAANAPIVAVVLAGTEGDRAAAIAAADAVEKLAEAAGKTVYRLAAGRPTAPKLSNFAEVGAIVLIAPPSGQALPPAVARDVGVPVLAPGEAVLAFGGRDVAAEWNADTYARLPLAAVPAAAAAAMDTLAGTESLARFSLVDGGLHGGEAEEAGAGDLALAATSTLTTRTDRALTATTAAAFLAHAREFTGLEAPSAGAAAKAPAAAVAGRGGRAAGYDGER